MDSNKGYVETLEQVVDAVTLRATLRMLVDVCHGKAEHLNTNWQDPKMASVWEDAAKALDKAAERCSVLEV
jgi:hypothetical protein